jgi:hypothetical protein
VGGGFGRQGVVGVGDEPQHSVIANYYRLRAAGKFILMLSLYWPKEAIVENSWKPPGVKRVE